MEDADDYYLSVLDMDSLDHKFSLDFNTSHGDFLKNAKLVGQELIFERVEYDPSGDYDTFGFISIHTSKIDGSDIFIDGTNKIFEAATYNRWDRVENPFDDSKVIVIYPMST